MGALCEARERRSGRIERVREFRAWHRAQSLRPVLIATLWLSFSTTGSTAAPERWRSEHSPQTIIGGEVTAPGEFPSVVAILAGAGLCTGTLVAPRVILTAAHCLANIEPHQSVQVFFGDQVNAVDSITATRFGRHPSFCRSCKQELYDFGYVLLPEEADEIFDVEPIEPLWDQVEWDHLMGVGTTVTVVGYGSDPSLEGLSHGIGIKRKVQTRISRFSRVGIEFFAGGEEKDSCQGDSGGPALVRGSRGTWRLAGVVSRGSTPCGDGGIYGIPYPALEWLGEETGVHLCGPTCASCDCLEMRPPNLRRSGACTAAASSPAPAPWSLVLLLALVRRRRVEGITRPTRRRFRPR